MMASDTEVWLGVLWFVATVVGFLLFLAVGAWWSSRSSVDGEGDAITYPEFVPPSPLPRKARRPVVEVHYPQSARHYQLKEGLRRQ